MITSLRALARALGGEISGHEVLCPGPGHGPRDRSLSVKLSATSPDGFVAHSFANDDFMACRDYVRQKLGLPPWAPGTQDPGAKRPAPSKSKPSAATTAADAWSLWRQGVDPRGTPAEAYLGARRLPLAADLAGRVIRWHPGQGAILALFRDIRSDAARAVSRTFLDHDGRKLERKFLGPVGGLSSRRRRDRARRIETCLAARELGQARDILERLEAKPKKEDEDSMMMNRARRFLSDALANGPRLAAEVLAEGAAQGLSKDALKRALHRLGGSSEKPSFGAGWVWTFRKAISNLTNNHAPFTVLAFFGAHFRLKSPGKWLLAEGSMGCALRALFGVHARAMFCFIRNFHPQTARTTPKDAMGCALRRLP
jgi:hypothetical protein